MIIEKSPYHKSNLGQINSNELVEQKENKDSEKIDSEDFSFWSWFKGLINPLQNLPLVSGIYSSVNSENEESDRDLIQNSLGGFLYGGPIGAIAGFGTWAFNKIFDKTPTEMALDATGISNIWKDDGSENVKDKEFVDAGNPRIVDNNYKLHIQYASSKDFYKENLNKKIGDFASIKPSLAKEPKLAGTLNTKIEKQPEIVVADKVDKILTQKQEGLNTIESELKNASSGKDDYKFREINFTYPSWKPNEKIRIDKKVEDIQKEYQELGQWELPNKQRFKYDA